MKEKMQDKEIVKALEYCFVEKSCCDCAFVHNGCLNKLGKNSIDLIHRLQAENEELRICQGLANNREFYSKFLKEVWQKQEGKKLSHPDFDYIYRVYFEQKAEIERLKDYNENLQTANTHLSNTLLDEVKTAKAEAVKEFAERLKESLMSRYRHFLNIDADGFEWLTIDAVNTHIDEVATEMKGVIQ